MTNNSTIHGDLKVEGGVTVDTDKVGIDTTFIDNDGNTITVVKGIITAKTAP